MVGECLVEEAFVCLMILKVKERESLQTLQRCSPDDLKPLSRLCGIYGREDSPMVYTPWQQNHRLGSKSLTHRLLQSFQIQSVAFPQQSVRLQ